MLIKIDTKCANCGHSVRQVVSQTEVNVADGINVKLLVDPHCPGCEAAKKCSRNVPPAGTTIEVRCVKGGKPSHKVLYCAGRRDSFSAKIKASPDFCTALEGRGTEYTYWRLPSEDKWSD